MLVRSLSSMSPYMWNRECITATSGARKRTCISGVPRVLDRNGPLAPCRRRIKSRNSPRVLLHAPLTVTNWASSTRDSTMPSGSCRPHASLNRNSISRIASSSALVMMTFPVLVALPALRDYLLPPHAVGLPALAVDREACKARILWYWRRVIRSLVGAEHQRLPRGGGRGALPS